MLLGPGGQRAGRWRHRREGWGSRNFGAKRILGPSAQGPDPPLSLTPQGSTGLTPTRAVLGTPSGCSATSQREGRLVCCPGMMSHR